MSTNKGGRDREKQAEMGRGGVPSEGENTGDPGRSGWLLSARRRTEVGPS